MFDRVKNVFIVGIKGAAMVNIALILKKMGKNVTGSDSSEEFITDELLRVNDISYSSGFEPSNLSSRTEAVVYSAANGGENNPQIVEAKKRNLKVLHQAALIEEIIQQFKTKIAVCGSHGKTTTAALLAYTLSKLGQKPSYLVGAQFGDMWGGDYQQGDYFVLEADEYAVNPPQDKTPKLNFYHPDYILALNADLDHPDVYDSIEQVKSTFLAFFQGKKIYACCDDENLQDIVRKLPREAYKTFGCSDKADLQISNVVANETSTTFDVTLDSAQAGMTFETQLYGKKNISNIAGVILVLLDLGFGFEEIKKSIRDFSGAKRRFEKRAFINDTYLFDDYAHHPSEIEASIEAGRERFPKRRIIVIFQPHTYSRTKMLYSEFGIELEKADQSLIAPIFSSSRENPKDFTVTSFDIANGRENIHAYESNEGLMLELEKILKRGDVIFTMGAGDIYKLEDDIIRIINRL